MVGIAPGQSSQHRERVAVAEPDGDVDRANSGVVGDRAITARSEERGDDRRIVERGCSVQCCAAVHDAMVGVGAVTDELLDCVEMGV